MGNRVFIQSNLKEKWEFPRFVRAIPFESRDVIKGNSAIVICDRGFLTSVDSGFFSRYRVIVDCVDEGCNSLELREMCFNDPFFIALKEEERSLKGVFDFKGIPLEEISEQGFFGLVYSSEKMEGIVSLVKKVAKTDATVLIRGESGTGKELIAKAIHRLSARKSKPFVAVNCASIPDTLLEAELFGHKKGAFTDAYTDRKGKFEQADGGTIFLDEIGDMPLSLQAKILRALQEREITPLGSNRSVKVDVRVLSATSRNLEDMVKKGEFREDLYYRLNVIDITLPPLRERREDIPLLAEFFLKKFSLKHGIRKPQIEEGGLRLIKGYEWKGNVRELENFIEKMVVLYSDKGVITKGDVREGLKGF